MFELVTATHHFVLGRPVDKYLGGVLELCYLTSFNELWPDQTEHRFKALTHILGLRRPVFGSWLNSRFGWSCADRVFGGRSYMRAKYYPSV